MEAATRRVAEHASNVCWSRRTIACRDERYHYAGFRIRCYVRAAVDCHGVARQIRTDTCLVGPVEVAERSAETAVVRTILRAGNLASLVGEGSANLPTTDHSI